jgi:hypothetical protein
MKRDRLKAACVTLHRKDSSRRTKLAICADRSKQPHTIGRRLEAKGSRRAEISTYRCARGWSFRAPPFRMAAKGRMNGNARMKAA